MDVQPDATLVGLPWFEAEDYCALAEALNGYATLPERYEDWLDHLRVLESLLRLSGTRVHWVRLAPDEFIEWCCDNDRSADATACMDFATELARLCFARPPRAD